MFTITYDYDEKKLEYENATFENEDAVFFIEGTVKADGDIRDLFGKIPFGELISGFNGCFAVAFYDKRKDELYVGRDRLGAKQIYYSVRDGRIILSTDFEPVFRFAGRRIDTDALQNFFSFQYVPEPMTIGEDVFALELGNYIKASDEDFVSFRYNIWMPEPVKKDRHEFKEEIREKLIAAVSEDLDGAKEPAAFLSGGLDSSILAAIAAKDHRNLTAYTIAFDVPGFSEADVAAESAKKYGIKHEIVKVDSKEFADTVPYAVKAMGVPVADPSAVAVSLIAKAAVGKTDVIMSGEGSDELWGGYHVYNPRGRVLKLMKLPKWLKKAMWAVIDLFPDEMNGKDFFRRGLVPLEKRFIGNTFLFTDREKKKFLRHFDKRVKYTDVTKAYYDEAKGLSDMDRMQFIDTNIWLPGDIDVVCGKGCSVRGLNCVTPFMNNNVTDLARTLTRDEKLDGEQNKVILREAFSDMLTDEVTNGKKKGYPVPVRIWLSGELNDWARNVIRDSHVDEYINKAYAYRLLDKCRSNPDNPVYYRKAWAIVIFCIWNNVMRG